MSILYKMASRIQSFFLFYFYLKKKKKVKYFFHFVFVFFFGVQITLIVGSPQLYLRRSLRSVCCA